MLLDCFGLSHFSDSEAEELDAALGGVFSFLSMKEVSADDICWN